MSNSSSIIEVHRKFRAIGHALMHVNGNNTHSGNLSLRDPHDPDIFYITASGSQGGELSLRDVVPVKVSSVSWGDARASTESNIHRRILRLPHVNASIHCHYIVSTIVTFDTKEKQIFLRYLGDDDQGRDGFLFQPVDVYGASAVGGVHVGTYRQPVGSAEMEERIPGYLADSPITLVRGHGPFVRGASLEECLYRLGVLEGSTLLAMQLRRRGVDLGQIQQKIMDKGFDAVFPFHPHELAIQESNTSQAGDKATIADFRNWLSYNYNSGIGAYGTGSMSQRVTANEMIYCPMSAVPELIDFPLHRLSLERSETDSRDLALHKLIYQRSSFNTCMIATCPMATAEGMAVLADHFGTGALLGEKIPLLYTPKSHPVIAPIDAEAIYLNPRLGLVDISQVVDESPDNPILNMLHWYKGCCVVAGYGVISVGDTTLEQAAHNVASAERIGRFRMEIFINEKMLDGPSLKTFEPKTR